MSSHLLMAHQLVFGYGREPVVNGVSLAVRRGELLGIIGPNGAGKSTLLALLGRMRRPWSGSIKIDGRDTADHSVREFACRVAMVSQTDEKGPDFSVLEFVMMGRNPHRRAFALPDVEDYEAVAEALAETGTEDLAGRSLNELSGGERQRATLAQALAQRPDILLLDEPTSHLDIGRQREILDLVTRLVAERAMAGVIVLHDLNMAAEYCSRLALMDRGAIATAGLPGEVLTYQTIERIYRTIVIVQENPVSGKPFVIPVAGKHIAGMNAR